MKWIVRVVLGVAALLLLAAGTLFAVGLRSDAGLTRVSVEIARPPEKVWPWLKEPDKLKAWVGWLVEIHQPSADKYQWFMEDPNNGNQREEVDAVVTANEPPHRLALHIATPGAFDGDQSYILTDLGGGRTRLDTEGRYHYDVWMARLMEPVITHESTKKMVDDLARMKAKIEEAQ
jgi:uncharacterized protein YndB with AHSA1/START domain